jgi:hypothetical protein
MDEDDGCRVLFVSTFLGCPEARDVDEVAGSSHITNDKISQRRLEIRR